MTAADRYATPAAFRRALMSDNVLLMWIKIINPSG
jgi:hypothetical protein